MGGAVFAFREEWDGGAFALASGEDGHGLMDGGWDHFL